MQYLDRNSTTKAIKTAKPKTPKRSDQEEAFGALLQIDPIDQLDDTPRTAEQTEFERKRKREEAGYKMVSHSTL